jgi:hypothetical protein
VAAALLHILTGWIVWAALFLGLGRLVSSRFAHPDDAVPLATPFWAGVVIAIAFLQLWNLLGPVDVRAVIALSVLAAVGWALLLRHREPWPIRPVPTATSAALVLWLSTRALAAPQAGDNCLYYLQTVSWLRAFPVVRGLGNLHHRLAFNQAYHLLAAAMDSAPWPGIGAHLTSGLLLLGLAVPAIFALRRPGPSRLLWALLLTVSLDEWLGLNLTSPAADLAVGCFDALAVIWLAEPLLDKAAPSIGRLRRLLCLAPFALVIKMNAVGVVVPCAIAALWLGIHTYGFARIRREALWCFGLWAPILVLPWMLRGLLLSGYPAFPFTFPDLKLPWRVAPDIGRLEVGYIKSLARVASSAWTRDPQHYTWFRHWLSQTWEQPRVYGIPLLGIVLGAAAVLVQRIRVGRWPCSAPALAALSVSFVWWFAMMPDQRFVGPFLWLFTGLLALGVIEPTSVSPQTVQRTGLTLAAIVLVSGLLPAERLLVLPHTIEPAPPDRYRIVRIPTGDELWVARGCCTSLRCVRDEVTAEHLRFRRPGDLSAGFESMLVTPQRASALGAAPR